MKPMDMGYQQARGIGNVKFDTEQNISLEPETQAIRKSALPNALGYIAQQTPYITESLKSSVTGTKTAGTAASSIVSNTTPTVSNTTPLMANTSLLPTSQVASVPMHTWNSMGAFSNAGSALSPIVPTAWSSGSSALQNAVSTIGNTAATTTGGITSQVVGTMADKVAQTGGQLLSNSAQQAVDQAIEKSLSSSSAGSGALGVAGKALAGVGTALGAYTMANQIADFGSHRSGSDMMANVGRQHITTDRGNSYTNYNGVNMAQEVALENANTRAKQLGFGMNAIGTGASVGSFFGPIGTGIGAAAGLLLGGLGSLFGWGDNEEEVRRQVTMTNDNIAMYNRQQEAVAKSKDVASEFSDRQGVATAAVGKNAYGPMKMLKTYNAKKYNFNVNPDGTVSYGPTGSKIEGMEVIGNPNGDTAIAPGNPSEGDVVNSSITPYDDSFVISNRNPYIKNARRIAKEQNRLDKIIANASGSEEQQSLQIKEAEKMKIINANKLMKIANYNPANLRQNKYENGKLPFSWEKGLTMAAPHIWGLLQNAANYKKDKYADIRSYNPYVEDPLSERAINDLYRIRFDARPYFNEARKQLNYANFNTARNVGIGAGGMEIAKNANLLGYLRTIGDINAQANEFNARHATTAAQTAAQVGQNRQARQIQGNSNWYQWLREAAAMKHNNLRTDQLNMYKTLGQSVEDFYKSIYADRAENMNERMMQMYGQSLANDKLKILNDINSWNPTRTIPQITNVSANQETELDEDTLHYLRGLRARRQLNNIYQTA